MKQPSILLIGDLCEDVEYQGEVKSICPEAPVPILKVNSTSKRQGMVGITKQILTSLAKIHLFSQESINSDLTKKIRLKVKHQIVYRMDFDKQLVLAEQLALKTKIHKFILKCNKLDAILIQDYGKGTITKELIRMLLFVAESRQIPILVDPHGSVDWRIYEGVDFIFPNLHEFNLKYDVARPPVLYSTFIIKHGVKGVQIYTQYELSKFYALPPKLIVNNSDAVGAGDAFIAGFAIEYIYSKSVSKSIKEAQRITSKYLKEKNYE